MTYKLISFILLEIVLLQVKFFWWNISWWVVLAPIWVPTFFYGGLLLIFFIVSLRLAGKEWEH